MACTISAEEIKRVKGLGFLNNKGTDLFNGRVITVNGKITAAQAKVIAEAAEKFGNGDVEFTTRLTVEVRGIHFDNIEPFREYIAREGLQTGGTGSVVRPVVSCKGTTCQYGLYDTFALSEKIHERFYLGYRTVKLPHKFKIATGGCPNNCVKPDLNDLGIVGQLVPNFDEDMCNGCKKCKIEKTCPMKAATVKMAFWKLIKMYAITADVVLDSAHLMLLKREHQDIRFTLAEDGAKKLHRDSRFLRFSHQKKRYWM